MAEGQNRQGPVGLQEHELEALVALIRIVVGLDEVFSEEESDAIGSIALEVGEEAFWPHMQASQQRELSLPAVIELAKAVERKEAREAIFISVQALASSDSTDRAEAGVLQRLQQLWNLDLSHKP